ncbi:MAG: hypothetical protein KDM64_13605 [Verrucomicrobiae bacterium]|nr:hypothetical protein [Verrucomicrobiae bacterium]
MEEDAALPTTDRPNSMKDILGQLFVLLLALYSVIVFIVALWMRHRMIKAFGRTTVYISQIVTLMNSYKSAVIWFQLVAGFACVGWGGVKWAEWLKSPDWSFGEVGTLWLPSLVFAIGLTILANQLRPGGVFLLGKSMKARLQFQDRLNRELFGIRTVSLLSQEGDGEWALGSGHSFRTTFGNWEKSVEAFARVLGIVVFDFRDATTLTERELEILRHFRLGYKTVVISPSSLSNHEHSSILLNAKVVTSEDEAIQFIQRYLLSSKTRVSRDCPLISCS